jgi:hypothetical protein
VLGNGERGISGVLGRRQQERSVHRPHAMAAAGTVPGPQTCSAMWRAPV